MKPPALKDKDYLSDEGLDTVAVFIDKMPRAFEVGHQQGWMTKMQATIAFPTRPGPDSQLEAFEQVLNGAMLADSLVKNLVAERSSRRRLVEGISEILRKGNYDDASIDEIKALLEAET
jgi:hypothetical protein